MNQQKLREWILKQKYFSLNPYYDGMTAWELAGIIIREAQDEKNYAYKNVGAKKGIGFAEGNHPKHHKEVEWSQEETEEHQASLNSSNPCYYCLADKN